ncbi:MAG: response regulator, partial [Eubacterium sp.]|nr:response regulator [Eubacterium sp.]
MINMYKTEQKIFNVALIISCSIVVIYFLLGQTRLPSESFMDDSRYEELDGEWFLSVEGSKKEKIELPYKFESHYSEKRDYEQVVLSTKIPTQGLTNTSLVFWTKGNDFDIYVGDELRLRYNTRDSRWFGFDSPYQYVIAELKDEDAGKELRLETHFTYLANKNLEPVYLGDQYSIIQNASRGIGVEIAFAFLLIFVSIIAFIVSLALQRVIKQEVNLKYLACGTFIASFWILFNDSFRQFIFPNVSTVRDLAYFTAALLPLPFLIYMDELQMGRYKKVYAPMKSLVVCSFLLLILIHCLEFFELSEVEVIFELVDIISIGVIFITLAMDVKTGEIKNYKLPGIGIGGVALTGIIQLVLFIAPVDIYNGVLIEIGLMWCLTLVSIYTGKQISDINMEKNIALAENKAKSEFLANMSHEIRTPLNAILGLDTMILRQETTSDVRQYALDIKNSGEALLSLVNDILDLSKIEAGKLELVMGEYDLTALIHDVVNMISIRAKQKKLNLKLQIDRTLPSGLWGDDVRISQILINLLNNAVKYTEQGTVTLSISGDRVGENVLLHFSVKDTGIGIKEEDMEKLFAKFERLDEERNKNVEGTGLGMSITVQLLELMDGKLKVDSEYEKGSEFKFTIPQKIVRGEPIGDIEQKLKKPDGNYAYSVSFVAPDAKVLVTDDTLINRNVFCALLRKTKVQISQAESGMKCLEMCGKEKFDVIFLDHMMPEMDGVET